MKHKILNLWLAYTLGSILGCIGGYLFLTPETFPKDLLGALIALPIQQAILLMSFMAMFEHAAYIVPAVGWILVIIGAWVSWKKHALLGLLVVGTGAAALSWRAIYWYWGVMPI